MKGKRSKNLWKKIKLVTENWNTSCCPVSILLYSIIFHPLDSFFCLYFLSSFNQASGSVSAFHK